MDNRPCCASQFITKAHPPIGSGGGFFSFTAWFRIFSSLICKTFSAGLGLPFRLISFLISGKQFPRFYRVELRNKLISHAVALDTGICTICFVDNCSYLYLPS